MYCYQHLSNETILAVLGIAGTLFGTIGGAYFSYRSIDKQFSQSIKKMRIDRTFTTYESLLEIIIAAQSKAFVTHGDIRSPISPILVDPEIFRSWYTQFQTLWHQKQYLLDEKSLIACRSIAEHLAKFTAKYPQFKSGILENRNVQSVEINYQEVSSFHKEFLALLDVAHQSLRDFLLHKIEEAE
jgi:hypothetical protein